MRNILRVAATVFALLVATDVASAQGGGGARGGGGGGGRGQTGAMMAERWLNEVALTDDQKAKLAPIAVWYDSASAAIPRPQRNGDSPPDSAAMAAFQAGRTKLNADYQAKIKAVLTPEQVTKFDANIAAQGQRGGRGRGGF